MNIAFSDDVAGPVHMDDIHLGVGNRGDEEVALTRATYTHASTGTHAFRVHMSDYDLTWTARPADLKVPTEYDLGKITFTVTPR